MRPVQALAIALLLSVAACRKNVADTPPNRVVAVNDLIETRPPLLTPVTETINESIGGYYKALPEHYSETSKSYPLLIFIHGGGQFGNGELDLPLLLNDGITQLLDAKTFPPNFKIGGNN